MPVRVGFESNHLDGFERIPHCAVNTRIMSLFRHRRSDPLSRYLRHGVSLLFQDRCWEGIHTASGTSQGTTSSFYKTIDVKEMPDGKSHGIVFDGKYDLKTPAKKPFLVPSKYLAHSIAAEWMWQKGNKVEPETMPLMSLAATAIDEPQSGEMIATSLCSFLPTDPVLCREDDPSKVDLSVRQASILDPYIVYVNNLLGTRFHPSTSIVGAAISVKDAGLVKEYILGLDSWQRSALMELSSACKSLCMAIGGVQGEFTADELIHASRIEEEYQIQQWGLVEGGHDIDIVDIKVRIHSPLVFLNLLYTT